MLTRNEARDIAMKNSDGYLYTLNTILSQIENVAKKGNSKTVVTFNNINILVMIVDKLHELGYSAYEKSSDGNNYYDVVISW